MQFHPDIIVTGKDSPEVLLAVEARTNENEGAHVVSSMKNYLLRMSCPFGLLVFPRHIWIYRNSFSGGADETVKEIGRFPFALPGWNDAKFANAIEFEHSVQSWLEGVANKGELREGTRDLQSAFESHIIPILVSGNIRAAGPRTFTH